MQVGVPVVGTVGMLAAPQAMGGKVALVVGAVVLTTTGQEKVESLE
jgi:hypothetical protein